MWKTNGTIIYASLSTLFLTLDRLSKYKIINSADFIIFLDRVDTTEVCRSVYPTAVYYTYFQGT